MRALIPVVALAATSVAAFAFAQSPNPETYPEPRSRSSVVTKVHLELPRLDVDDTVRLSSDIVRARVTDKRPILLENGYVVTEYQLAVDDRVKGALAPTVTLRCIGGSFDDRATVAPDMPTLNLGEDVVVFARGAGGTESPRVLTCARTGAVRVDQDGRVRGALVRGDEHVYEFLSRVTTTVARQEAEAVR